MPVGRARAGKTSKTRPIFRTLTFCLVKRKKKTLHLQVFSGRGKAGNEKVTVNSKYYHDGVKIVFSTHAVCNFQSIKSSVELNSLLLKFFYITWLVISPD